ncbi:MAG: cobyric acid synthase [Lachnospiraceae bacterium]
MAKVIMVQGTMSNAGKSVTVAGLCRIFMQDGYKVAPFKSQNMALNSFITKNGLEMGRAQVMQAEACGIEPDVSMNPILLKPTNDVGSQIIVNGEVLGNMRAIDYFKYKKELIPDVLKAYKKLDDAYDIIVIEGAGSPAEINLKSDDIVNMGMAKMVDAPVLLVGDIDRGGVFASLYGTVKLLEQDEQDRIKGLIINKFRGDVKILEPGLKMLEDLVEKEVLGVIPCMNFDIDDEDSLSSRLDQTDIVAALDIAVIRLPHISNFTDFNALERFEQVSVRYVKSAGELKNPDLIILPGTKNTISDLLWLRQSGLEASIFKLKETPVIGICGGYQILGEVLDDPHGLEHGGTHKGMGLLPTHTIFEEEKTRTRVRGRVGDLTGFFEKCSGTSFEGYEIHMGKTTSSGDFMFSLDNDTVDGIVSDRVLGSYVHGIFDTGTFSEKLIELLLEAKGLSLDESVNYSMEEYKNKQYDILAAGMRENLDMKKIYEILGL